MSLEDMISGSGRLVSGELSQYSSKGTPFQPGDVLFGKLRPYLAKYWRADRPGTAGGDIHVYRPADDVDSRFLNYIVGSRDFVKYADAASKGVKMPRAEWMGLRELTVSHPDLPTQQRIADYLDRETGEIDAMLAAMDELTTSLEARRTAVIDRAFLPYIGVSSARLGLVAEAITGLTYAPADVVDDGGTIVHRSGSVQNSMIDRSDLLQVSTKIPDRLRLRKNDLLVCSRNGSAHLVGKSALIGEEEVDETWGAFMTVLRSPNNEYLRWYLQSTLFAHERSQYSTSTINQLTIGMINRLEIPFPDATEQTRIADHLDEVTGQIDAMLDKVATLKSLLTERRAALITDVVTGRKDVA
ncbi:restriction endonuclease subunit S [Microbacterium esteraromaticum]|uniref:restriction endonuclease subunit S n=1 Tax=Microbacterium esteraromaticum TaxID=57043 RepID=UPI0015C66511|nr:restriction endonuclease subunit S [Microbacterium esteraromaticum]